MKLMLERRVTIPNLTGGSVNLYWLMPHQVKLWSRRIKSSKPKSQYIMYNDKTYVLCGSPGKPDQFYEECPAEGPGKGVPQSLLVNVPFVEDLPASRWSIALSAMRNSLPVSGGLTTEDGVPYVELQTLFLNIQLPDITNRGGQFLLNPKLKELKYVSPASYAVTEHSLQAGDKITKDQVIGVLIKEGYAREVRALADGVVYKATPNGVVVISIRNLVDGDKMCNFHGDKGVVEFNENFDWGDIDIIVPINMKRGLRSESREAFANGEFGEMGLVGMMRWMVLNNPADVAWSEYHASSKLPFSTSYGGPRRTYQVLTAARAAGIRFKPTKANEFTRTVLKTAQEILKGNRDIELPDLSDLTVRSRGRIIWQHPWERAKTDKELRDALLDVGALQVATKLLPRILFPRGRGFRGVVLAHEKDPDVLYVPERIYKEYGKEIVAAWRNPALYSRSIYQFKLRPWTDIGPDKPWVIGIHADVLENMDGDCDGDQLDVAPAIPDPKTRASARVQVSQNEVVEELHDLIPKKEAKIQDWVKTQSDIKGCMGSAVALQLRVTAACGLEYYDKFGEECNKIINKYYKGDRRETLRNLWRGINPFGARYTSATLRRALNDPKLALASSGYEGLALEWFKTLNVEWL